VEWDRRVRDHQARRASGWRTIESCAVAEVLTDPDASSPVLVDCQSTHLDGLADTADGLGSRRPAGQALEGLLVAAAVRWLACRRFGGMTGDVYGALIELATATVLLVAALSG
jgi:adenosyl cobinamide kinase/adenosyl cobinamide phosphate guanylyltransferase